jgi:tripartite-type tricarboxylate transporter receptor subunit TctC
MVPFPAGGSNDVVARVLAQKLSEQSGYQIVVDNRAGAGGNIGADLVAKAAPDGYTLLLTAPGPLAINKSLYRKISFDPETDFAPVALVATVPIVMMVNPSIPAKTVTELVELAKSKPGKLGFGSSGNGSTNHLAGELFMSLAGIKLLHVPYRGAAPAMADLLGGQISILFDNMPAALPQVQAGSVRALAVAGSTRSEALPDLPTIAESGVPGFEASAWFGLVAPAKTPAPVLGRLTQAITKALEAPDTVARFKTLGAAPGNLTGAAFGHFLRAQTIKWSKVVETSGAKVN